MMQENVGGSDGNKRRRRVWIAQEELHSLAAYTDATDRRLEQTEMSLRKEVTQRLVLQKRLRDAELNRQHLLAVQTQQEILRDALADSVAQLAKKVLVEESPSNVTESDGGADDLVRIIHTAGDRTPPSDVHGTGSADEIAPHSPRDAARTARDEPEIWPDNNDTNNNNGVTVYTITEARPRGTVHIDAYPRHHETTTSHGHRKCGTPRVSCFIPCLASPNAVARILAVSTREVFALDAVMRDAGHRRQLLRWTALDFGLWSSNTESSKDGSGAKNGNGDLRRDASPKRLDPHLPLCPYELAGECADPFCSYQHITPRSSIANVMPREFLPLPTITISKKVDVLSDRRPHDQSEATRKYAAKVVRTNAVDSEDGYIPLPQPAKPPIATAPQDSSCKNEHLGCLAWWDTSGIISNFMQCPHPFSQIREIFSFDTDEVRFLIEDSDRIPSALYIWLGKVSGICALSTHAGRFDVACSLLQDINRRLRAKQQETQETAPNKSPMVLTRSRIAVGITTCFSRLLEKSFLYDSNPGDDIFLFAFQTQLKISLVSAYLHSLYTQEIDPTFSSTQTLHHFEEIWVGLEAALTSVPPAYCEVMEWEKLQQVLFSASRDEDRGEKPRKPRQNDINHGTASLFFLSSGGTLECLSLINRVQFSLNAIASLDSLMNTALRSSWSAFNHLFEDKKSGSSSSRHDLLFFSQIGSIVLACLRRASTAIELSDTGFAKSLMDYIELYNLTETILCWLESIPSTESWIDLLLAPLFAANIALGCRLQQYDKICRRLQDFLMHRPRNESCAGLCTFSELLWSQYIQLHFTLPYNIAMGNMDGQNGHSSLTWEIPMEVNKSHQAMCQVLSSREVSPHHVVAPHDQTMVYEVIPVLSSESKISSEREDKFSENEKAEGGRVFTSSCSSSIRDFYNLEHEPMSFVFHRDSACMENGGSRLYPGIPLSIPTGLLFAGSSLKSLSLNGFGLERLPDHMDMYFPKLTSLEIKENSLVILPESICNLTQLRVLRIDRNMLGSLPSVFQMVSLVELTAARNKLTTLPASLAECLNLQVLDVSGNPINCDLLWFAARLKHLRVLHPMSELV
jgi:hypothetical protein